MISCGLQFHWQCRSTTPLAPLLQVLTDAPLKRIKAEKPQYEMKLFDFVLANPFQVRYPHSRLSSVQVSLHEDEAKRYPSAG